MASVRGRLTRPKDGDYCAKQRKTTTVFFFVHLWPVVVTFDDE